MNRNCVYVQLMLQMYMNNVSCRELSDLTGISYATLRRKLRGGSEFLLCEALRIKETLHCGMPLENLFQKRSDCP